MSAVPRMSPSAHLARVTGGGRVLPLVDRSDPVAVADWSLRVSPGPCTWTCPMRTHGGACTCGSRHGMVHGR